MTITEAMHAADLLVTLDDAKEWRETFTETKHSYIGLEQVVSADNIRCDGVRGGWEGSLRLNKGAAIAMMEWLEKNMRDELAKLGVKD